MGSGDGMMILGAFIMVIVFEGGLMIWETANGDITSVAILLSNTTWAHKMRNLYYWNLYYWFVPNKTVYYIKNGRWIYRGKIDGGTVEQWKHLVNQQNYFLSRAQKILLKYYVGPMK